jgi:hypothetical protein
VQLAGKQAIASNVSRIVGGMEPMNDPPGGRPVRAEDASGFRLTPQFLLGLLVSAIGVLFTLENLRIIEDAYEYLRYWPAGLVLIGLLKILQPRPGLGGSLVGFLLTIGGTWLLLEEADVLRISFWNLWPLLLVFAGGYLVWQGVAAPRPRDAFNANATISALAVLGAVVRGNNSPAFRGGDLTAIMGGCEIDLRQAAIHGDAIIDIFALWGGIELRVPETWTVVSKVVPFMGGFDDQTRPPQAAGVHRLVIRGFILMAGVDVKN